MDKKRLNELRTQVAGWTEGYSRNDRRIANGIILCVPVLLDEIERLLALVEQRDARSLKAAWAGEQHIAELDTKNERLLGALRQAESGCLHPTDGRTVGGFDPGRGPYTVVRCWICKREMRIYIVSMERVGKHEDDCVFAMLEGGDSFATKDQ